MLSTTAGDGPFNGFPHVTAALKRDPSLPIRVTYQHYRGTDGVSADGTIGVSAADVKGLADTVKGVYNAAVAAGSGSGSLVVDSASELAKRATAPKAGSGGGGALPAFAQSPGDLFK